MFNKPVQAKHAPGYFEKIKEPKDLGTIFNNLKDGIYSTAHQVRKDVTLVWKNCLIFNGPDSGNVDQIRSDQISPDSVHADLLAKDLQ